ncbi:hypothetical protein INT47_010164 [Mucor saturninus]|uniref:RTA1-domain-containing protein n=1 Tax=Mucor saturninus TaxID=64648 RepID=A0A8H7REY0_9FUNG|nr:hypothetical protein INT47_010164 [Mucor saturninus]
MSTQITISELDLAYFHYIPNRPACYVGIAVFSILFILLNIRVLTSGYRWYVYLLPLTAAAEVVGFALRYICSKNPTTDVFTAMSILLLISANIMALVNYKAVGDVIQLSGVETRYYVIGPNFARNFYKTNLVASILQAVGGGLQASSGSRSTGFTLTIVGITIQLVFFAIFLVSVHYVNTCPDYRLHYNGQNHKRSVMRVMYITMALLFVRSLYRLANYVIVYNNFGEVHEWTFYVFDALLIAVCFLIHCIWFIGHYIPRGTLDIEGKGPDAIYITRSNV